FSTLPGPPGKTYVHALAEDAEGTLWIGTPIGLYSKDPGTKGVTRHVEGLPSVEITAVALASRDRPVVGTEAGAFILEKGVFHSPAGEAARTGGRTLSLLAAPNDMVWLASGESVSCWKIPSDGGKPSATVFGASDGLPPGVVTAMVLAKDGTLWVGTTRGVA